MMFKSGHKGCCELSSDREWWSELQEEYTRLGALDEEGNQEEGER